MLLSSVIQISDRLAKSANVERDAGRSTFKEYHLTGRGLDVLSQICRGMIEPSAGRAFSITGPYGSGKSSFGVFLEALFGGVDSERYVEAIQHLAATDVELAERWRKGRHALDPKGRTPVRAFVTAKREPLVYSLSRALHNGDHRDKSHKFVVPRHFAEPEESSVTASEVRQIAFQLSQSAPLIILVDEFGKNLEAFGESGAAGDPFLLQEFAEASQGPEAAPIVIVTMQHLAFDEYVGDAGTARRREWAKVQGRFHDIGFVESPQQTRELIAAAFVDRDAELEDEVMTWYAAHRRAYEAASLTSTSEVAARSYPLHPVVLDALPELCARYGQNERTLYSFLAGSDGGSLPSLLERLDFEPGGELPFIGLNQVYDYFLEAASSFVGASAYAARWLEIETRIRDTLGLTDLQVKVLKSIGILNLVSSGGAVRASRQLLQILVADCMGSGAAEELPSVLTALESHGLITYREFADEYRIWNGSDFDIRFAIDNGRAVAAQMSPNDLLRSQIKLGPVIAGSHSQRNGVLRVFPRIVLSATDVDTFDFGIGSDAVDGYIVLAPTSGIEFPDIFVPDVPVVIGVAINDTLLLSLATEALAIQSALEDIDASSRDWVARRELAERLAAVQVALKNEAELQWHPAAASWEMISVNGDRVPLESKSNLSTLLSAVCDSVYSATPRVANEMIARRELTSQGAKARRMVGEQIFAASEKDQLGIVGYGPERAIYEAILRNTGVHSLEAESGNWKFGEPSDPLWAGVWRSLQERVIELSRERVPLDQLTKHLTVAPFGLKQGVISVILLSVLQSRIEDIALYEYGNLVLAVDDAVVERMLKNPGAFASRNVGGSHGTRRQLVEAISSRLSIGRGASPTFLQVARALFKEVRGLEPYSQQTKVVSERSINVRTAFREAVEPDILLFEAIPVLLGHAPVSTSTKNVPADQLSAIANDLADVLLELKNAYSDLLSRIRSSIADIFVSLADLPSLRSDLTRRSRSVEIDSLEPDIRALVAALQREHLPDEPWLENLAMVIAGGTAPRAWADSTEAKFAVRLSELGFRFRRLEALWFGGSADPEVDSRRLTLTWPDGSELTEVVRNSGSLPRQVPDLLEPTVSVLAKSLGGDRSARLQMAVWLLGSLQSEQVSSKIVEMGDSNG